MINFIKRSLGWYPLSQVPEGFFRPDHTNDYRYATPREANSLSPVYAAKDLYKRSMALCPLITYRKTSDGGRIRADSHPAYTLLKDQPNPSMSAITFLERFVDDYFTHGEFLCVIRWKGNNNIHGLYPIPHSAIVEVKVVVEDDEWHKVYRIREDNNTITDYADADIIHVMKDSKDGVRGCSIFDFAGENLGLHRQIAESANAFFKNAVQPSVYVNQLNPASMEQRRQEQADFERSYAGTKNAGKVPFVANSTVNAFPSTTAEESGLLEALNRSIADAARWFGCSASDLGDRENSKYNSLAADNASFFRLSLSPVQTKLQDEINRKTFGVGSDTYCEFLTRGILQGDPAQEQQILNGYIQSGVMTRAEAREVLNLPPIPGLDAPLYPLNQGATPALPQPPAQDASA